MPRPSTLSSTTLLLLALLALLLAHATLAGPLGRSQLRATHVPPEKRSLAQLFVWPNSYYDRPRHRYPYYDERGTGRLLYGYGGQTLYKYSVYRPLEGYF